MKNLKLIPELQDLLILEQMRDSQLDEGLASKIAAAALAVAMTLIPNKSSATQINPSRDSATSINVSPAQRDIANKIEISMRRNNVISFEDLPKQEKEKIENIAKSKTSIAIPPRETRAITPNRPTGRTIVPNR